ncbi:hypothetical protein E2C01_044397 [Portunus trituberculatus]|uniref:Uncharacterized protein n=1 Tax=Portunus trituberculatus TaxID=210409 RepID=A0A5B7G0C2_PORTR|nr:hypothetical protein [Portunus trituberculatus]
MGRVNRRRFSSSPSSNCSSPITGPVNEAATCFNFQFLVSKRLMAKRFKVSAGIRTDVSTLTSTGGFPRVHFHYLINE